MSEGRFDRIENRLDRFETRFDSLEARFDALEARFDALEARFDALEARFDALEARFDAIDRRLTKVEILQEEMSDRIAIIAEGHAATQAAIVRSQDVIIAHIDLRIDPLERALRAHLGTN